MTPFPGSHGFDLILPGRIAFGWGRRSEIGQLAAGLGQRAFLVDGSRKLRTTAAWDEMLIRLEGAGLHVEHIATATREPTIADVDEAAARVHALNPRAGDLVIGIGGGSALDLAKAVAAMATNGRGASVRDFLEGVGTGRKLEHDPLPILAVPTTAGTGAEATKNAVISVDDPPCKKSLRSDQLMPRVALVDPELTVTCPPQQTAWSGMDALTQLIESGVSRKAPLGGVLPGISISSFCIAVNTAYCDGRNQVARMELSRAAMWSGVALTACGLGMAHGVAAALGAVCQIPHGLACAVMLPISIRVNCVHQEIAHRYLALTYFGLGAELPPIRRVSPIHQQIFDQLGKDALGYFTGDIRQLCEEIQIPTRLRDIGVRFDQIPAIVAGSRGNSMSCNPRDLSDDELTRILEEHW